MKTSLVDQFAERGARIEALEKELTAARESADKAKSDLAAAAEAHDKTSAEHAAQVKDLQDKITGMELAKTEADAQIKTLQDQLKAANDKLTLAPFKDVSSGTAQVPDGGQAKDQVQDDLPKTDDEWIAKDQALTGPDKFKFYAEHKAEIDAAYKRKDARR